MMCQRLMDIVLTGLNHLVCLVYLDDVIIFSHDIASHMERLKDVFERFRQANLKFRPDK